jgi:hypothetical protein
LSHIQLIAAPAFIGTKIEAFKARGRGDFLSSHDLEDILTLVDGRDTLLAEINAAPIALRQYLSTAFSEWLLNQDFLQAYLDICPQTLQVSDAWVDYWVCCMPLRAMRKKVLKRPVVSRGTCWRRL